MIMTKFILTLQTVFFIKSALSCSGRLLFNKYAFSNALYYNITYSIHLIIAAIAYFFLKCRVLCLI